MSGGLLDRWSRRKLASAGKALLAKRDDIQTKLDAWHRANPGPITDMAAYQAFLRDTGY